MVPASAKRTRSSGHEAGAVEVLAPGNVSGVVAGMVALSVAGRQWLKWTWGRMRSSQRGRYQFQLPSQNPQAALQVVGIDIPTDVVYMLPFLAVMAALIVAALVTVIVGLPTTGSW